MRNWFASQKWLLCALFFCLVAWKPCYPFTIKSHVGNLQIRASCQQSDSTPGARSLAANRLRISNNNLSPSSNNNTGASNFFIPTEELEQLQDSVDIVSVVESYGLPQFRRSGEHQATCLCPFHDDRNPSMSIDSRRGIFKCFSCGAGGNVFNFVREYSKVQGNELSFYQTVRLVNDQFAGGMALSLKPDKFSSSSPGGAERRAKRERVLEANSEAANFFEESLTSIPAGPARSHIRSRGLKVDTVRSFRVGFAPESYFPGKQTGYRRWGDGSLVNHLKDKGFTPDEILDAGLAIRTKKGKQLEANSTAADYTTLMDRFRGRLLVPILDATGNNVLGFGGREIDLTKKEDQQRINAPKYLNSPESVVFQKKKILFGGHMAKQAVSIAQKKGDFSRPIVIVEGYMDAIALWQAGIREAVACLGTALTLEQLVAAGRLQNSPNARVILCLDNDQAGAGAIERLCSGSIISSAVEQCSVEFRVAHLPDGIKDPAEFIEAMGGKGNPEERFREDVIENSIEWTQWYVNHIVSGYDAESARGSNGSFGAIFDRLAAFLAGFPNAAERTKRAVELGSTLAKVLASGANSTKPSKTVQTQLESDLVEKASMIANERSAISNRISFLADESDTNVKNALANIAKGDGLTGSDENIMMRRKKQTRTPSRDSESRSASSVMDGVSDDRTGPEQAPSNDDWVRRTRTRQSTRRFRPRRNVVGKRETPPLTPHFSGFSFNPNDARWLGLIDKEGKGNPDALLPDNVRNKMGEVNELGQKRVVYFNSNDYHGNQFLSDEAIEAGYTKRTIKKSADMFEKGIATLLTRDEHSILISTENRLLRTLVLYASARSAVMTMLETNLASGSNGIIEWSSEEKEWLFARLTSQQHQLPPHIAGPDDLNDLRIHLMREANAFPNAISPAPSLDDSNGPAEDDAAQDVAALPGTASGEEDTFVKEGPVNPGANDAFPLAEPTRTNEEEAELFALGLSDSFDAAPSGSTGVLDCFFSAAPEALENTELAIAPEEKAELAAQEHFASLILVSAKKRLSDKIRFLSDAASSLFKSDGESLSDETMQDVRAQEGSNSRGGGAILLVGPDSFSLPSKNVTLSRDGLMALCNNLTAEVQDEIKQVKHLTAANRRMSERLLEASAIESSRRAEEASYNKMCQNLKNHMAELDQWSAPLPEGELSPEDEPYEDYFERLKQEVGDLYEDDRTWSPEDAVLDIPLPDFNTDHLLNDSSDDDQESIEEFEARMQRDWGWLEEQEDLTELQQVQAVDLNELQLESPRDIS